jgi:cyclic pyranopterin phosphate synthase
MTNKLTHLNSTGTATMVNVGSKTPTDRLARATGVIKMSVDALTAIKTGDAPKGNVLGTARIAAIMAAKETAKIIPLCHPLPIDFISIDFEFLADGIRVFSNVKITGKTGVEMEAMVAVTVALLTIYDMAKALDKGMIIENVRLLEKRGGKSGDWAKN